MDSELRMRADMDDGESVQVQESILMVLGKSEPANQQWCPQSDDNNV